jgi:hypothetical protein
MEFQTRAAPCLTSSFLRALDSIHLAFVTHSIYYYAVSNFGDYGALQKVASSARIFPINTKRKCVRCRSFGKDFVGVF